MLKKCQRGDVNGGQGRNRTIDTRIFSPLLYRLSYLAGYQLQVTSYKPQVICWAPSPTREGVLNP